MTQSKSHKFKIQTFLNLITYLDVEKSNYPNIWYLLINTTEISPWQGQTKQIIITKIRSPNFDHFSRHPKVKLSTYFVLIKKRCLPRFLFCKIYTSDILYIKKIATYCKICLTINRKRFPTYPSILKSQMSLSSKYSTCRA